MSDAATAITARDGAAAVQRHCGALRTDGGDCDARLTALRGIADLARADLSRHAGFAALMGGHVRDALLRHLEDPRAAVAAATCEALSALAAHSSRRGAAQCVAEPFVAPLLRGAARGGRHGAAAAEAVAAIAAADALSAAGFAEVLRGAAARHAGTRAAALAALRASAARGVRDADGFARALRVGLADADAAVRRGARECYWAFAAAAPDAAARLLRGLEHRTRRAVERASPGPAAEAARGPFAPATPRRALCGAQGDEAREGEAEDDPLFAAELWPLLRDGMKSAAWADRLSAVRRAAASFIALPQPAECAQLIVTRLSDPNRRVAQAALDALPVIECNAHAALCEALPEAVVALLVNVRGGRHPLADASRARLEEFADTFPPEDIVRAALCAAEDVVAPAVRARAVDYVQRVAERHPAHFAQVAPMTHAVTLMLRTMQRERREGEVTRAALAALVALHSLAKQTFLRSLASLEQAERVFVIEALSSTLPNLAQEFAHCRVTPKAAPVSSDSVRKKEETKKSDVIGRKEETKQSDVIGRNEETKQSDVIGRNEETKQSDVIGRNEETKKSDVIGRNEETKQSDVIGRKEETKQSDVIGRNEETKQSDVIGRNEETKKSDVIGRNEETKQSDVIGRKEEMRKKSVECNNCYAWGPREARQGRLPSAAAVLDRLAASRTADEMCAALDCCAPLLRGPGAAAHAARLVPHLERCASAPDHRARERSFDALRTAAEAPALRAALAPRLRRAVALARAGLDDPFEPVRVPAAALLRAAVAAPGGRAALAAVLGEWLGAGDAADCTRGWIALLAELPADGDAEGARRAAAVACRALRHAAAEVRLAGVVLCVRLWTALGDEALQWFAALSASERKLVSIYYNKDADERGAERRDLTCDMRAAVNSNITHLPSLSYLVYAVDSADRLTLLGPPLTDGVPTVTHFALSFINAPKVARRISSGEFAAEDPCAGDAVEFVRNLCIGKPVKFSEDYKIDALDRRAGRITLVNDDDLTSILLQNGYASLPEHIPARGDKALLTKYAALSREAQEAKKGIFDPTAARRVRILVDLSRNELVKLGEQLKGKEIIVRVEQVLLPSILIASADRFGATHIAVHMPGITVKDADCMALKTAARFDTERLLLHRKVKILFEGVDNLRNILGSVVSAKGNFQTELIAKGYAKLDGSTLGFTDCAKQMQSAEEEAKSKRVGIWKQYENISSGKLQVDHKYADSGNPGLPTKNNDGSAGPEYKGPLIFNGVIIQIINGATIAVRSEETYEVVRISLAGVRSSKNVKRDQDGRTQEARVVYGDYEWEAREFLRTHFIGKRVFVQVEFARQIAETKDVRPVAIVKVHETDVSINVSILETGFVSFFLGRNDICSAATLLQGASDWARIACVGKYSKVPPPVVRVVELSHLGSARGKYYLSFLQSGMQGNRPPVIKGVVDAVLGGSTVRVYIPREHFQIPVKIAGILSPMGGVAGSSEKPDEYAEESKRFAVDTLQQRSVDVQVHTADKAGNFISTIMLTDGGMNYGVAAVKAGLATVGNAESLPYFQQLLEAERAAQSAKKCIWSDGVKIPQRALKLEAERNASNMNVFRRVDAAQSVALPYTLTEAGEDGVSVYVAERSEEAERQYTELQKMVAQAATKGKAYHAKRGEMVLAQYSEDNSWNRVRVIKAKKGEDILNVHFIDAGNTSEVRVKGVRMIPSGPEFAAVRDTPDLAILARLAFLRTKMPTSEYAKYAYDTIYDYTDGSVIARELYRDSSGDRYFTVAINENVPSLSETLLQKGMAVLDRQTSVISPSEYVRHEAAQNIALRGHKCMWQYGDISDDSDFE